MKHFKHSIGVALSLLLISGAQAQNVGIGTTTPNTSAILDISANNKGLLVPRVALVSLADVATIATPATGLIVYNTNAALSGGVGFYYNSGTTAAAAWTKFQTGSGGGSGWALTGNAGTDSTVNFIGTTDLKPLTFRVNNQYAGMLGSNGLIALGRGAVETEKSPTSGVIAIGDSVLFNSAQDFSEIAIGNQAMFSNSAPGDGDNVAIGNFSMILGTGGFQNVGVGNLTLALSDTSFSNVAVGFRASFGTTGEQNVAVGAQALDNDQVGFNNTAVGFAALNSNGNGFYNVGIGSEALISNFEGNRNVAVGRAALASDSSGIRNTSLGYFSGISTYTGSRNIAIGAYSMRTNSSGSNNICIGDSADAINLASPATVLNNAISIGSVSIVNASNKVVIGNVAHTSIGGQVGWSTFSDGRYKKDVEENVSGLNFIMKLRPVTYQYDFDKINGELYGRSGNNNITQGLKMQSLASFRSGVNSSNASGRKQTRSLTINDYGKGRSNSAPGLDNPNEGVRFTGFIAQEVEAAAQKAGFDFSGVDKPTNDKANYALRYAEFVVPLVKAVQEQQAIIDAQNKKIEELTKRLEKVEQKN